MNARARRALRSCATVVICLTLLGCGSDQITADQLEQELASAVEEKERGSSLSNVQCVKRSDRRFRCVGDYEMSRQAAKATMDGIDTTYFTDADWDALIRQRSGTVAYTVDVGEEGEFVYEQR